MIFYCAENSINKLTRIVSIATKENEAELAAKIKVLSVRALETLVRDEKMVTKISSGENDMSDPTCLPTTQNGFNKPLNVEDLHVQMRRNIEEGSSQALEFELDDDIQQELNELNSKGIDVNELIRKMLMRRKEKIAQDKEEIAKNMEIAESAKIKGMAANKSRYIPVRIKKILCDEHGNKCSIPTCAKPAEIIHHTQRFGLSQNHDPHFLAPLCKEHHAIAHSMDIKYRQVLSHSRAMPSEAPQCGA